MSEYDGGVIMNEIDKLNDTLEWTNKGHKILTLLVITIGILVIVGCAVFVVALN